MKDRQSSDAASQAATSDQKVLSMHLYIHDMYITL